VKLARRSPGPPMGPFGRLPYGTINGADLTTMLSNWTA